MAYVNIRQICVAELQMMSFSQISLLRKIIDRDTEINTLSAVTSIPDIAL